MTKLPTDILTGQERNDLRDELVNIHGLSVGQATPIINADDRAGIVTKMIEICKEFTK